MMGGDGVVEEEEPELSEMELSAVQESMNQMMGGSATALSELVNEAIDISPPTIKVIELEEEVQRLGEEDKNKVVRISFELEVEGLIKSKLYQMIGMDNAKKLAQKLLSPDEEEKEQKQSESKEAELQKSKESKKGSDESKTNVTGLLGDVEVEVEVRFGSNVMSIEDILSLTHGELVELKERTEESLGIYANGTRIGEGEIMNVEGHFGVEIKKVY